MSFESVSDATRLWIKGREFTVGRLLGEKYKTEASRYKDGALVIFRLAPQDYHRFHSPVEGTIGPIDYISGEYYTVNVCLFFLFHILRVTSLIAQHSLEFPCFFLILHSLKRSGRPSTSMVKMHAKLSRSIVHSLAVLWLCALVQ